MKIIVTIPAYNEERSIGAVIRNIRKVMQSKKYNFQVLVVDDGSKDNTVSEARKAGAVVFSHPANYGLAEAFRTELQKCLEMKADVIVHTDADGQYVAEEIPKLVEKVSEGYELVLGSRFKGRIESMPLLKRFGNKAFSYEISKIVKIRITDAQTGFRAFTSKVAQIPMTSTHTYTQEQIIRAVKNKFRVIEVPITFRRRVHGKSRLMTGPIDFALKAWINIFRIYRDYEPLKFFGTLGWSFFIVGFLLGLWIFYSIATTGDAGGIPRVILSAMLMLTGIQVILFGFLADMWRK